MFTQPVSPPPPGLQSVNPVSPSRPSRLRGLSYLRNYTHNHLLSRDSHSNSSGSGSGSANNSPRGQSGQQQQHQPPPSRELRATSSYTPAPVSSAALSQNPNRLTLINSSPNASTSSPHLLAIPGTNGVAARAASGSSPPTIPEIDSLTAAQPAQPAQPAATNGLPESSSSPLASSSTAMRVVRPRPASTGDAAAVGSGNASSSAANGSSDSTPSLRFSAYYDPRSTRPSLSFPPITRTLPNGSDVIRVGRYSERDGQAASMSSSQPSAAPVGFKSKVVSRRHCEFWCEDGKWYIKDVKSSSGTFLNHIRLSPPSQESKAFAVNDGDIVQLGIDFKGGEEMIFRCVKMRLELNRGWQNKLNSFNVAAHKALRTMAKSGTSAPGSADSSSSSQDCSICLNSIAPCQSLFVAPCSHTWHFKCVRSLLTSPQYPIFVCPNCRAGADLEADVDEPSEEWEQLDVDHMDTDKPDAVDDNDEGHGRGGGGGGEGQGGDAGSAEPEALDAPALDAPALDVDPMDVTVSVNVTESPSGGRTLGAAEPQAIRGSASRSGRVSHLREERSPSPSSSGPEGPITPRNNAGPWVFDGSAGQRAVADGSPEMRSLDAATEADARAANQSEDPAR